MNDALLVILTVIGFLAIYWVLIGQWKYNKMMSQGDNKVVSQNVSKGNEVMRNEEKPPAKAE
ncbi:hypothetical protein GOV09_02145 [Candidatus Woesearchaeota archaeon]|nr:hypothetical protein [Candidatus Woesearchaeota archaeon]